MEKPRFILFDYGQTLVNELEASQRKGMEALLHQAAANPHGLTAEDAVAEYERIIDDISYADHWLDPHIYDVWNHLYDRHGLRFDRPMKELELLYIDATLKTAPTEGIESLLRELRRQGIPFGVVSNINYSAACVRHIIGRHLPLDWFQFVLTSSEQVFRKPHRRIFEAALARAGVPASEVLFCGDNPVCDCEGSHGVGMASVWYTGAIRNPETPAPRCPHTIISDWRDLPTLWAPEPAVNPVTSLA